MTNSDRPSVARPAAGAGAVRASSSAFWDWDCVVYMPLRPDVEHLTRLLVAGINVATTAGFITGRACGEPARAALEEAARSGKASLFGSGINPGWAEYLATVASGPCREVHHLRITESFNIGLWASDANQDELGWGRPAGDHGHAETVRQATAVFADAVESMAHQLGLTLDDIRCEVPADLANFRLEDVSAMGVHHRDAGGQRHPRRGGRPTGHRHLSRPADGCVAARAQAVSEGHPDHRCPHSISRCP